MSTHFEDIGYVFEDGQELVDLLNNNMEEAAYYDSADGQGECILLQPDRQTRFWYYKRKDEDFLCGLDLHYQGNAGFWMSRASWVVSDAEPKFKDDSGNLVPAKTQSRPMIGSSPAGTTVCVNMVEAPLMGDPDSSCSLHLAVTAFCEEAKVDEEVSEESFIPIGIFTAEGEAAQPRATMTATVKSAVLQRNGNSGKFFYEAAVSCLGMDFTLVGNAAALKGIPKEGRTVSGTFWLSATVREVKYLSDIE